MITGFDIGGSAVKCSGWFKNVEEWGNIVSGEAKTIFDGCNVIWGARSIIFCALIWKIGDGVYLGGCEEMTLVWMNYGFLCFLGLKSYITSSYS